MAGSDDPTFERLADWLEGRLSEEESREVEERLSRSDEATRADAEWLREFLALGSEVELAAPPSEVRDHILRVYESRPEARQSRDVPGIFKRFMASLIFDSDSGIATTGLRSAGAGSGEAGRQLVYTAQAAEVTLDVRPLPADNLELDGQVLPAEARPEEFSIQLLRGDTEFGITSADDLGEFKFETVPPGVYKLVLGAEGFEIVIGPVVLER